MATRLGTGDLTDGFDFSLVLIDDHYQVVDLNRAASLYIKARQTGIQTERRKCYELFFGRNSVCNHCPRQKYDSSLDELYKKSYRATQRISDEIPDDPAPRVVHLEQKQFVISADRGYLLVETLRDITIQKEKQDEAFRNEKLMSLGTVVQTVAHELGNPITGLNLTIQQLLNDPDLPDDLRPKVQLMNRDVELLANIVNDIRNFTKREGYRLFPVAIKPIVDRAADSVNSRNENLVSLRQHWEVPESIQVRGQEQKLYQVFYNLFKNSVEAFRTQKPRDELKVTIWVIVKMQDKGEEATLFDHPMLEMQVIDNAGGISSEHLHRVFDPYFSTKKRSGTGTGLGLFAVHKILEEHQGNIELESRGHYTRFIIHLPVRDRSGISN